MTKKKNEIDFIFERIKFELINIHKKHNISYVVGNQISGPLITAISLYLFSTYILGAITTYSTGWVWWAITLSLSKIMPQYKQKEIISKYIPENLKNKIGDKIGNILEYFETDKLVKKQFNEQKEKFEEKINEITGGNLGYFKQGIEITKEVYQVINNINVIVFNKITKTYPDLLPSIQEKIPQMPNINIPQMPNIEALEDPCEKYEELLDKYFKELPTETIFNKVCKKLKEIKENDNIKIDKFIKKFKFNPLQQKNKIQKDKKNKLLTYFPDTIQVKVDKKNKLLDLKKAIKCYDKKKGMFQDNKLFLDINLLAWWINVPKYVRVCLYLDLDNSSSKLSKNEKDLIKRFIEDYKKYPGFF